MDRAVARASSDTLITAAADLIRRCGGDQLLVDVISGPDGRQRSYWASATHEDALISVEHYASPVEAIEALLVTIVDRTRCYHCGRLMTVYNSWGQRCKHVLHDGRYERRCGPLGVPVND